MCPVCLGYPGALPVMNRKAVELALRAAFATGCTINERSIFARKNYFYPDLPKGYQISQYDRPFSSDGRLEIVTAERDEGGHAREWRPFEVRITRLHLEEDAGKNVHEGLPRTDRYSYIDLNRAGTPLAEIVTEPDFRTSWEAYDYVNHVRRALQWVGASEADMEKGNLRCEANVSVRRVGEEKFGTKVELKNLNSVRFMQRAIEFEIERQIALIESGGRVAQETRLWDERASETRVMRSKEEAHDYRYFPEPDLLPLDVERAWIEDVARALPEMPQARVVTYRLQGLSLVDAEALVVTRELAEYFEAVAEASGNPRAASNWVRNDVLRVLNDTGEYRIKPESLGRLIRMIDSGAIGGKAAKEVFEEIAAGGGEPDAIVERKGLGQISDAGVIRDAAARVVEKHPTQVADYRGGKQQIFGFLVGQLMKEMRGKADARIANEVLRELLG